MKTSRLTPIVVSAAALGMLVAGSPARAQRNTPTPACRIPAPSDSIRSTVHLVGRPGSLRDEPLTAYPTPAEFNRLGLVLQQLHASMAVPSAVAIDSSAEVA